MYKLKTLKFFCVRPLLYALFFAIRTPIADNTAITQSQLELYFTRKILQHWLKLILCCNTGMEVTLCAETAKLLSLQARTLWWDKRCLIKIKVIQTIHQTLRKAFNSNLKARKIVTGVKSVLVKFFIASILKSMVILSIWLALIGAIYSRIAHLTINLQEREIYFFNFTNQLNQWFTETIISYQRWYGRGKENQQLDCDN